MSIALSPLTAAGIKTGPRSSLTTSGRNSPDTPHPDSSVSKRKFPFSSPEMTLQAEDEGSAGRSGQEAEAAEGQNAKEPVFPSRLDLSFSVPSNSTFSSFHLPVSTEAGAKRSAKFPLGNLHRSSLDLESPTQSSSAGSVDSQATVRQAKIGSSQFSPLSSSSIGDPPSPFPLNNANDIRSQAYKTPLPNGLPPPTPVSAGSINYAQLLETQRDMQRAKDMTIPMQMEVDKDFLQGPQAGTWADAMQGRTGDEGESRWNLAGHEAGWLM